METSVDQRRRLAARMGFWGAIGILFLFLSYTVIFTLIQLAGPSAPWTNLSDYVVSTHSSSQTLKLIAQAGMLLFCPLYLMVINSLYEIAPDLQKSLLRLSLVFAVVFAALTGMHYFVQISAAPQQIASGQTTGLEQWVQANPYSGLAAANMLGWSLFFGLSSLLAAPLFTTGRLERTTRILFFINGAACLLGGVGYVFVILPLVLICSTFLMGGAVTGIGITLSIYFRRIERMPCKGISMA
jgi:hypothetical protein